MRFYTVTERGELQWEAYRRLVTAMAYCDEQNGVKCSFVEHPADRGPTTWTHEVSQFVITAHDTEEE